MTPPLLRALRALPMLGALALLTPLDARAECERQCKPGQTRDVNGCCVGGVTPTAPKTPKAPKPPHPANTPATPSAARLDGGPAQISWVVIPHGTFKMGSMEGHDASPVRDVTVDRFAMAQTETTVAQYERCVSAGSCNVPEECHLGSEFRTYGQAGKADHPVNCVTWFQARDFCLWADGRLPTEAEWEYAARGTDGRKFAWGNRAPGARSGRLGNFADASGKAYEPSWTVISGYDDGFAATAPVGSFPAGRSPFGLDDMAGNVWEWVADWYGDYGVSATTNPTGPSTGEFRVYRGGSFDVGPVYILRAATRGANAPSIPGAHLGFRCARSVQPVQPAGPRPCPAGMERGPDTAGQCCWPGQAWSTAQSRCIGSPSSCHESCVEQPKTPPSEPGGVDWVQIPAGTFTMGSDDGDSHEKPVRRVQLSAFWMARTETTVEQYGRCVAAGACSLPSCNSDYLTFGKSGMERHPVNCVKWSQASEFCRWTGGRLPTEAEWEYAARGTDARKFPWGDSSPTSWLANCDESKCGDGFPGTSPVSSFPSGRSPFGLDDMAGNVQEWVADWYGAYDESRTNDPTGPSTGGIRVFRGGGFFSDVVHDLRAAYRYGIAPSWLVDDLGFRCARSP